MFSLRPHPRAQQSSRAQFPINLSGALSFSFTLPQPPNPPLPPGLRAHRYTLYSVKRVENYFQVRQRLRDADDHNGVQAAIVCFAAPIAEGPHGVWVCRSKENAHVWLTGNPVCSTCLQRKAFANQVEAQQYQEGDKYNRTTMRQWLFHGRWHPFRLRPVHLGARTPAHPPTAPHTADSSARTSINGAPAMAAALTRQLGAARLGYQRVRTLQARATRTGLSSS